MDGERLTAELSEETIRSAFDRMVDMGSQHGSKVTVLFGFAWGNHIHDWKDQVMTWAEVAEAVRIAEENGDGTIGSDDLYLTIGPDEFIFCHHSDIHYPDRPTTELGKALWDYLETLPPNKARERTRAPRL
jgi:hypothetical protein